MARREAPGHRVITYSESVVVAYRFTCISGGET
jgi:hypothetical protein